VKREASLLESALAGLEREHLLRRRRIVELKDESGVVIEVDGRRLVDFCSNDYLGLARHPEVAAAMSAAALEHGAGSRASHLVTGHGREHDLLEQELAAFTGRERALLFSTGYMANLATIAAFTGRGEAALLDRLNHASLIDGALLSGARFARYAHADVAAAKRELESAADAVTVIATDGVFSMDGDLAPLPELARAAKDHGAWLLVDDAHGLGVIGRTGRGTLEHFGLGMDDVPLLVGTLGKAFGSAGAFVAGPSDAIEWLMQKARTYRYTTAMPQPVAAATRKALEVSQRESWRRARVLALTGRLRAAAARLGVPLMDSITPIQPILLGSSEAALQAQESLAANGFWVVAIRPPTVPRDTARLRITLSAAHSEEQVDALAEALGRVCANSPRTEASGGS
jgi:8-amino-7-oxononanoate synthase